MPTPRPIAAASAGAEILAETTTIPLAAASAGAEFAAATTTIPGLFWDRVQRWSTRVALREKDFGVWRETTWADYGERVRACSFGLIACGLEAGERVAILSETRPEWLWADLGTLCAGGVTAGIYATDPAERCAYVVGHAGARIWVVEDQEQFDKAMQVRDDLPELRWIVVVDPKGLRQVDDARVMTFDELLERGRELERVQPELLEQRLAIIDADDMAGLFYTSGTTGPPKGVMHSHRSLLDGLELGLAEMGIGERDETLAHMPLCHLVERLFSLLMSLRCGHKVNFTENPETVFQNLQEVAPTFFCGVPRIWEILKAHVDIGMEEAVWGKRQIYRLALKIGYRRASDQLDGRDLPQWLRPLWFLANFAVFRKLRQCLGLGRARLATVGAAPVAPEVVVFFRALGVPLLEIYGQTEAGITVWTPADSSWLISGVSGETMRPSTQTCP